MLRFPLDQYLHQKVTLVTVRSHEGNHGALCCFTIKQKSSDISLINTFDVGILVDIIPEIILILQNYLLVTTYRIGCFYLSALERIVEFELLKNISK